MARQPIELPLVLSMVTIRKVEAEFRHCVRCIRIEIKNETTGGIKCFGVNRCLSKRSVDESTKIVLTVHSNYPCEKVQEEWQDLARPPGLTNEQLSRVTKNREHRSSPNEQPFLKRYVVTTKTGNRMFAGTDANVFMRLYDDEQRQSEDIPLDRTVTNKRPFEKHSIDEFHVGTREKLSNLAKVRLWHNAGTHHGWHIQWLQVNDIHANRLYCFPVVSGNDRHEQ